jgi:hypothetical protein
MPSADIGNAPGVRAMGGSLLLHRNKPASRYAVRLRLGRISLHPDFPEP